MPPKNQSVVTRLRVFFPAARDHLCLKRCHWSNNFLSGENSFTSKDSLINHLKEEAEPLVEGDGAVPVLVHLGEGLLPLLRQLEGGGQPEPLLGGRGDRDHCWELEAGNLTISVCVGSLRV